ncbi:uncharacterized protein VTP21DRAFT_8173 [Calcarisporiella thermophila]|uniref:uncharacterized protein n=1 Tax=Calcarisporiella thermophila TaxID=911321 RepID=UPI0037444BF0
MASARFPVIIDTDPGIDDTLALLLAFASPLLDVRAITVTHGNTSLENATRNVITIMNVLEEEIKHLSTRTSVPEETSGNVTEARKKFQWSKPVIAMGASSPLEIEQVAAGHVHGLDGLANIHQEAPEYSPAYWRQLFTAKELAAESALASAPQSSIYTTTSIPAYQEILRQLREAPPFTVTLITLGPMTNLALAYREDPVTFSRVRRIISMGGALATPGNITPTSEFNYAADPHAVRVIFDATHGFIPGDRGLQLRRALIEKGEPAPVHLTVVSTDVTTKCCLPESSLTDYVSNMDTPLGRFAAFFLKFSFERITKISNGNFEMHDPLCLGLMVDWAALQPEGEGEKRATSEQDSELAHDLGQLGWRTEFLDLRVECGGKYTRGMILEDKRGKGFDDYADERSTCVEWVRETPNPRFLRDFMKTVFDVQVRWDGN